jgi:murein DD-endopeptidase MepM/ murein hydrolase activator NlpD
MPFPLPFIPKQSYKHGGLRFGADRRKGQRKHAGCDLLAPKGTPIFAVADGFVVDPPWPFYHGCWAMAVNHGGYIVRYCEFMEPTKAQKERLRLGGSVTAGEVIAHVGKMLKDSMLHFEVYARQRPGPVHQPPQQALRASLRPGEPECPPGSAAAPRDAE